MRIWFAILSFAVAVMGFVGVSSSTALADTLPPDPKIILGPTGTQNTFDQTTCFLPETGCFFVVSSTDPNPTIDINNNLEAFIVQDTVTIESSTSLALTCEVFESAPGWTTGPAVGNSCIFNGGFISPGFKYGLTFSSFAVGTYFFDLADRTAATVPEPGTITLLGAGLAALAASRKKWLKGARLAL